MPIVSCSLVLKGVRHLLPLSPTKVQPAGSSRVGLFVLRLQPASANKTRPETEKRCCPSSACPQRAVPLTQHPLCWGAEGRSGSRTQHMHAHPCMHVRVHVQSPWAGVILTPAQHPATFHLNDAHTNNNNKKTVKCFGLVASPL